LAIPIKAMNIEEFRNYCIKKPGVREEFPFDNKTLVFKVGGKIFALTDIEKFESINLKCDPEKALEYRENFSAVMPGYHMNKKHWNTILIDGTINNNLLFKWIDDSYQLVFEKLNKQQKKQL